MYSQISDDTQNQSYPLGHHFLKLGESQRTRNAGVGGVRVSLHAHQDSEIQQWQNQQRYEMISISVQDTRNIRLLQEFLSHLAQVIILTLYVLRCPCIVYFSSTYGPMVLIQCILICKLPYLKLLDNQMF